MAHTPQPCPGKRPGVADGHRDAPRFAVLVRLHKAPEVRPGRRVAPRPPVGREGSWLPGSPLGQWGGLAGDDESTTLTERHRAVRPAGSPRRVAQAHGRSGDGFAVMASEVARQRLQPTCDPPVETSQEELREHVETCFGVSAARSLEQMTQEIDTALLGSEAPGFGAPMPAQSDGAGGGQGRVRGGAQKEKKDKACGTEPQRARAGAGRQDDQQGEKAGVGGESPGSQSIRPVGGSDRRCQRIDRTEGWKGRESEGAEAPDEVQGRVPPASKKPGDGCQEGPDQGRGGHGQHLVPKHCGQRGEQGRETAQRITEGDEHTFPSRLCTTE